MNKRSMAVTFVILLFVFLAFSIVYVFTELYTESDIPIVKASESQKFKEEFESLNNKEINGTVLSSIEIPVNNPFLVRNLKDINTLIDNKESFYVLFASPEDEKARLIINLLIETAKENGIKKIYYVNISNDIDEYTLNDKNKLEKTKEGSEEYIKTLEYFDSVLDDYEPFTYLNSKGKTKLVYVKEKRIFTPVLIKVDNGTPLGKEEGIKELTEITKEVECSINEKYKCLFEKAIADSTVCDINTICKKD